MILWNAKRLKVVHNGFIEIPLCFERTPSECINTDVGVNLGFLPSGWAGKAMRLMHDEAHIPVARKNLEGITQCLMNGFHESNLLLLGILPPNFN